MAESLSERFSHVTDEFLVEQYYCRRNEYTPEAAACMEEEIARRGIDEQEIERIISRIAPHRQEEEGPAPTPDDFEPLPGLFRLADVHAVYPLLRDAGIPVVPLGDGERTGEGELEILVPRESAESARSIIGEHFSIEEGRYRLKYRSPRYRLLALNFYEIAHGPSFDSIAVSLSHEERRRIGSCAAYVRDHAAEIEAGRGGMLFYYDNIDELIRRLSTSGTIEMDPGGVCTLLEVLQACCDRDDFDERLLDAIVPLLDLLNA